MFCILFRNRVCNVHNAKDQVCVEKDHERVFLNTYKGFKEKLTGIGIAASVTLGRLTQKQYGWNKKDYSH